MEKSLLEGQNLKFRINGGNLMSIQKYNEAKKILSKNSDMIFSIGGADEQTISKAEDILSLKFPEDYRAFLKDYGILSIGAEEIYGIVKDDFFNSSVPDAIWYTLIERKEVSMPPYLVVIYDTTIGELFCLNYDKINDNNEPKVTSYMAGIDEESQTYEVIANSFGEFLLERVSNEI